jgi:hypothetical protein
MNTIIDNLVAEFNNSVCLEESELREMIGLLLAWRAELKQDAKRLQFVIIEGITISSMNGSAQPMVYQCQWHDCRQSDWYPSPSEAIDAAMQAAQ